MKGSLLPAVLRYADQVARSGSIQKAARELHVAASAINRQILELEDALGVPLFERLPRGMRLTPSGSTIVTLARRWRDDERRAADDIQHMQGVQQGHVQLVAMDSHVSSILPALVDSLAESHPRISLQITTATPDAATHALVDGSAQVAAIFNLAPRREVLALWSAELPLGCIVAPRHPLARRKSISLQEASAHPIALQDKSLLIRRYLESHYSWLFSDPQGHVETSSVSLVKMLVRTGRFLAFTSELDAAQELIDGALRFVPVRDKGAEPQTVSVAINAAKPLPVWVRTVADALRLQIEHFLAEVRARA
ncbi:LysR family transcriptional regulator [Leptospira sp. 96542]|nr:LysR family transcriptional regulator [Leptospira sp. 96542]